MKYLVACLVVAAFTLFAGYANAQDMTVGVMGAFAFEAFDQDAVWTGIGADPDEIKGSWGGGVYVTYGWNENLEIVGDFMYYFGFSPDVTALEDYDLSIWTIMGGIRYKFAMDAEWTPYVTGGIGWGKFETEAPAGLTFTIPDEGGVTDTEQTGLVARVGGGIEYALSDTTSLFGDVGYVFTFGDVENWNFFDVRVGVGMGF